MAKNRAVSALGSSSNPKGIEPMKHILEILEDQALVAVVLLASACVIIASTLNIVRCLAP